MSQGLFKMKASLTILSNVINTKQFFDNQSVAVLSSFASEDEEERQDDDDVASDDDGLFPSMMIITLFSAAGVPSKRIGI